MLRRTLLGTWLLCSALQAGAARAETQRKNLDVLEHYRHFPKKLIKTYFPLTRKGDAWVTKSTAGWELSATVDILNGYIHIADEGTGGGTIDLQFVLFKTADRKPLIALCETDMDGIGVTHGLRFFLRRGGAWTDVTKTVLPPISIRDFIDQDWLQANRSKVDSLLESIGEKYSGFHFELPRHGTTIKVHAKLSMLVSICPMLGVDAVDDLDCQALSERKARDVIALKWNRAKTRFER